MARPQETPFFDDDYEEAATASGCGCFRRFCFGWNGSDSRNYIMQEREGGLPHKRTWIVAKFEEVREFSEVVAGPKWKNLIRKVGKICSPRKDKNRAAEQFGYSPESYALNFAGDGGGEDANLLHSFSTRFAPGFSVNDQQKRGAL